jgi:hypothetical protein
MITNTLPFFECRAMSDNEKAKPDPIKKGDTLKTDLWDKLDAETTGKALAKKHKVKVAVFQLREVMEFDNTEADFEF